MTLETFEKYQPAFDYITANQPMHIIEYGGGQSTFYLNQHLDNLGYGGKVTAFEDNPEFFNYSVEQGWNTNNSIKLVNCEMVNEDGGIVRYIHSTEGLEDVDFIILDGPDYRVHLMEDGSISSATDNIIALSNELGREIPFWIEGREGTQNLMKDSGYNMVTEWYTYE